MIKFFKLNISQKYWLTHQNIETWESNEWQEFIAPTLCNKKTQFLDD
jgi:hypothetical protein